MLRTNAFATYMGLGLPTTKPAAARAAAAKAPRRTASAPAPTAKGTSAPDAAVMAERARCAQIVAHGIKHGCVQQAGHLAFDSDMPAAQAIAVLNMRPVASSPRTPKVPDDPLAKAKTKANRIVAAFENINQLNK